MSVTAPMVDDNNTPHNPDEAPISLLIVVVSKHERIMPTIITIIKNWGKIFLNAFHDFFNALMLFSLSLICGYFNYSAIELLMLFVCKN